MGTPNNQATAQTTSGTTELLFIQGNAYTAVANRRIRITATLSGYGSNATDQFIFNVRAGTTVAGTLIGTGHRVTVGASAAYSETPITFFDLVSPAAGTRQYLVSCVRASGSGTYTIEDADVRTNWILTEDMGPSGAPA
jgi:hypothetical protein